MRWIEKYKVPVGEQLPDLDDHFQRPDEVAVPIPNAGVALGSWDIPSIRRRKRDDLHSVRRKARQVLPDRAD